MREMYDILSLLGWVWCAVVFLFLAVKSRRMPRGSQSED
jgi:hypothetical protein